jgi:hypothetical protein
MNKLSDIIDSKAGHQLDDFDIDSVAPEEQIKLLIALRYRSDTNDRKWLAKWTAWTVSIWLFIVLNILVFNKSCINLSDSVLIALLGTTTLNVLGLSFIVLRGHFNSSNN